MGLLSDEELIKQRIQELENIRPRSAEEFDEIEYKIRLLLSQLAFWEK